MKETGWRLQGKENEQGRMEQFSEKMAKWKERYTVR